MGIMGRTMNIKFIIVVCNLLWIVVFQYLTSNNILSDWLNYNLQNNTPDLPLNIYGYASKIGGSAWLKSP